MSVPATVLPWHSAALEQLLGLAARGRLPHALLVSGPSGTGKDWFALCLAAALLGIDLPAGAEPRQPLLPAHPDLRRLEVPEDKRQIPVDAVRAVVGFAVSRAQAGEYKVLLVTPADAMNQNAANALLKTLEEPSPGTVLVLVSHRPGGLLPTVRSRCQHLPLPMPDTAAADHWLATHLADPAVRAEALAAAGGAPLEALELHAEGVVAVFGQLRQLLAGPVQVVPAGTALVGRGSQAEQTERVMRVVLWWQRLLAETLLGLQTGQLPPGPGVPPDAAQGHAFMDRLTTARALLEGTSNPQPRLLLESLFIGWNRLLAGRSIDSA